MFRPLLVLLVSSAAALDCKTPPAGNSTDWLDGCCPIIYQRCNQTVPMALASGAPSDYLDPSAQTPNLPAILSIPASPFKVLTTGDPMAAQAYASHTSAGNSDYCGTMHDAHFCLLGVSAFGGPYFAQCIPKTCSQRDYQLLALNCSVRRVSRTIHSLNDTLHLLQSESDSLDHVIKQIVNISGANKSQIENMTHTIEEIAGGALAGLLGVNLTQDQLNDLINGLHNGAFDAAGNQLAGIADQVTYFGSKFLNAEFGFCSDDKMAAVDTSAGFLIAFTAALGFVCLSATLYELFWLPHLINAEEDFRAVHPQIALPQPAKHYVLGQLVSQDDSAAAQGICTAEMKWIQTLRPEHTAWIKETNYHTPTYKAVKMFSMYSHTLDLLQKRTPGEFRCLNGMRTLSTGYIVLGHMYMVIGLLGQAANKVPGVQEFATSFAGVIITGSFLSVDTFYFLSGFLGGYILIRSIEKMRGWLDLLKAYPVILAHRYMRLTPIYAYVLWFWISGTPLLITGPNAGNPAYTTPNDFCTSHWFENLLYVNSWVPLSVNGVETCMGWSWYLANDMMYFFIMPLVLYLWAKHRKLGAMVLISIVLEHIICVFALTQKYNIGPFNTGDKNNGLYLYARPWTRCAPYFIGVALGLYFHHKKKALKAQSINTVAQPLSVIHCITYCFSGVLMATIAFIVPWLIIKDTDDGLLGRGTMSRTGNSFWNAFQRPLYTVGLCGIVHMFASGHGSLAKRFLEHSVFDILSNLTYGLYLWALLIMEVYERSMLVPTILRGDQLTWLFLGCIGLGFIVSYLSYIMIELPCAALTQLMLPSKKPKPQRSEDKGLKPDAEGDSTSASLLNNEDRGEALKDLEDVRDLRQRGVGAEGAPMDTS